MAKQYWTYIVASKSGTLYVGMTNDIFRRVFQHKNHLVEGFTAKYDCTRLVWYEEFSVVHNAIRREKEVKGWTRAKKIALIESGNPRWEDFAEHWGSQMLMRNESITTSEEAVRVKLPLTARSKDN
jgi:putative endonuclease